MGQIHVVWTNIHSSLWALTSGIGYPFSQCFQAPEELDCVFTHGRHNCFWCLEGMTLIGERHSAQLPTHDVQIASYFMAHTNLEDLELVANVMGD